jgi:hypothetical protein
MWYFTEAYKKWRYGSTNFKLKNWTETMKSSCLDDILRSFDKVSKKYIHSDVRLKIKNKKDAVTGTFRDVFGNEEKIKHPIFTQNEIARISSKRKLYPVLFFLLLVFEGMIYALLANLITPRDLREAFPPITLIFGLGFAIVFVVALHFGFQYYFSYLEAKQIIEEKNLGKEKLRKYVVKRNMAYFVFFVFIVTNLATAIIRALILEPKGGDTHDYGTPLFVMSLGLTFIAAIAMGLIEYELFEKNEKYEMFKNWKRQNKERKEYMTAIKDLYFNSGKIIARFREEYWSVVLDYQRIFECRYDSIDEPLYNKFEAEIAAGTIKLNEIDDSIYSKYKLVQSSSEELFKYGVEHDLKLLAYMAEIKESVDEIAAYEKAVEEAEAENTVTTNESKS